jgi:hypothetical protein
MGDDLSVDNGVALSGRSFYRIYFKFGIQIKYCNIILCDDP